MSGPAPPDPFRGAGLFLSGSRLTSAWCLFGVRGVRPVPFGYYGQGVSVATAVLPAGWRDRVVRFDRADAEPSAAVCIEAHDLVVSKLVAGREKDISFAGALIRERLVDVSTLLEKDRPKERRPSTTSGPTSMKPGTTYRRPGSRPWHRSGQPRRRVRPGAMAI